MTMISNLTKDTLRKLRSIARYGRPKPGRDGGRWVGFDEADIHWLLRDHRHVTGRNFKKLRRELQEACKPVFPIRLCFWPFTKTQAQAVLREIRAAT